ncbi:MAG: 4-hydroxy-3-methylbut-2-enyl diphosphate reductase [Bacteroidota bacterium]|jgi:4-hydroxy-3-methylbut-2-enyl diphosphate reductase
MNVTIDPNSGFCFGVVYAIQMAEDELDETGKLYCLGDIVHNNMEVDRLKAKGLQIINHDDLANLHDCKVLIRAHGEPPSTYELALKNNIELIDASCPVVLKLQNRVKTSFEGIDNDAQIVIYGQPGHAEVNGLVGQTDGRAIVVFEEKDLDNIDYDKPVHFFSQTTKSTIGFEKMVRDIQERIVKHKGSLEDGDFITNDTLCRQVSNREPQLKRFATAYEVVVFVSGRKSSNGKALYTVCKNINPDSYFVSSADEIEADWFSGKQTVGIAGATSTPMWLMEQVKEKIEQMTVLESH